MRCHPGSRLRGAVPGAGKEDPGRKLKFIAKGKVHWSSGVLLLLLNFYISI